MADYNSSLPVRTEADGDVVGKIAGLTTANILEVNASNEALVHDADVATAVGGVETVLTDGTQKTKVTDGTDDLAINTDGSINVVVQDAGASADNVHVNGTSASVAINTPTTVATYTVTAGKTLLLKAIGASGKGAIKYDVKVGGVSKAVGFTSASNPTGEYIFPAPIEVTAGVIVLVSVTNIDKGASDLYAFINGVEVTP